MHGGLNTSNFFGKRPKKMVNQQNAGNILNLCLKSLNFSFYLILFPFAVLIMVFLPNFAQEIGARATRIHAFAHPRAFDRGERERVDFFSRFGPGGYSKKFYTGRLRPEVQPLTLLLIPFLTITNHSI